MINHARLSRLERLVAERTPPQQQIEFSLQTSLPEVATRRIGRLLRQTDPDRKERVKLSRSAAQGGDAFIGPALRRFANDLAGEVETVLSEQPEFERVIETFGSDLKSWIAKLLTDGDLFIHVAPTLGDDRQPDGGFDAAVSVDREPWLYERDSDEFDRNPAFSYNQDGSLIPIEETIVHARIGRVGRYGRPLFDAALIPAKTLADGERFEAKRWFLSSVITNRHLLPDYFTAEQANEYLASIAPVDKDDAFRDIGSKFPVTTTQGDPLGASMTQVMEYLIGRIDPSSPVPAPFLSSEMAAKVNRDTLTQMARDYRTSLGSWRQIILSEIVRPILLAVAELIGIDISAEIAAVTISKRHDLSPAEITQIIQTAQQATGSGLLPLEWVAEFLAEELGVSAEDVLKTTTQIDAIDAMDTDTPDGFGVDDGDQEG